MNSVVENNKSQYEKSLEHLKNDIGSLRTGRISPSLVENIF